MRILFMGTSDFAVASMRSLVDAGKTPCAVFSQPDRPRGRGYTMTPTPVKAYALTCGIPVYTPETLKDGAVLPLLRELAPDVICVAAYGKILPRYVLDFPKYRCINVHGSLLPKYRGAAPIQRAIMAGETVTGVTTMLMEEGLDTGDMLLKQEVPILPDDDFGTLHDKLAAVGGELLVRTLDALEAGTLVPEKQEGETCYASMIDNETRRLDFSLPAQQLVNRIRALSPAPCAVCTLDGKPVKIFRAHALAETTSLAPGEIVRGLCVATGDGVLSVDELQPEGKKRVAAADYLNGHKPVRFV
mgnify:CR=1 FL=1